MKILVIGATGATGQLAIPKLLAAGHEVTAFARRPEAVTTQHERLRVAQGDARDLASLERALAGQAAVFSSFGPRSFKRDDIQELFMKNLVAAMQKTGVKRLVNLSAWGASDSAPEANLLFRLIRATLLRAVFDDKERGEAILLGSPLDYVNVRPGRLLNSPARGGVKASLEGKGLRPMMTRADLADFMVAQLTDDRWLRQSPLIGY
ncbi:MAG: NAD(P)-dependent oxidoreductase [Deltaproteobacteria bacterium]